MKKKNSRIRFRGPNTNLGNQTYPSPGTSLSVSPSVNNCDLITSDSTSLLSRDDFFNLLAIRLYFPSLSSFFLAISKSLQNSLFTPKNYHIRFRQMFFFLFISSVAIQALVKKNKQYFFLLNFHQQTTKQNNVNCRNTNVVNGDGFVSVSTLFIYRWNAVGNE